MGINYKSHHERRKQEKEAKEKVSEEVIPLTNEIIEELIDLAKEVERKKVTSIKEPEHISKGNVLEDLGLPEEVVEELIKSIPKVKEHKKKAKKKTKKKAKKRLEKAITKTKELPDSYFGKETGE